MPPNPDPHGQAALMMCESLIILLVEEGVIRKQQVVDAVESAIEVKREIAGTTEGVVVSIASIGLLRTLSQSISASTPPAAPPVSASVVP